MVTNCKEPPVLVLEGATSPRLQWKKWEQHWIRYAASIKLLMKPPWLQVATFMTTIGPAGWQIMQNLQLSETEKLNLSVIVTRFDSYFDRQRNLVLERFRFNKLYQRYYYTFEEFLNRVRNAAETCDFGEMKEEFIRDRIVAGLQCRRTQSRLINVPGLTLRRTIEICRSCENVARPTRPVLSQRRAFRYSHPRARRRFDDNHWSGSSYDVNKVKIMEPSIEIKDAKEENGAAGVTIKKEIDDAESKKLEFVSNVIATVDIKQEVDPDTWRAEADVAENVKEEPADVNIDDIEMSLRADIDNMIRDMGLEWEVQQ